MFCDKCGTAVQADQRFCSRCGREFTGTMVVGYPRRSRVQEHIRLLGILWLALSAFNAVGQSCCTLSLTPDSFTCTSPPVRFCGCIPF